MQGNSITIGNVFRKGLNCFKARPWFWSGIMILTCIISEIVSWASTMFTEAAGQSSGSEEVAWGVSLVCLLLSMLVSIRIEMGLVWMGLVTVDGKTAKFSDLFAKPQLFWRYVFASIFRYVMVMAGFMLLIVPGIYLAARFFPQSYVLLDRQTGIMESFRRAQQLTEGHRGKLITLILLGFAVALVLIAGLMVLTTVLGSLAPMALPFAFIIAFLSIMAIGVPVVMLSLASFYRALRNASADQTAPA